MEFHAEVTIPVKLYSTILPCGSLLMRMDCQQPGNYPETLGETGPLLRRRGAPFPATGLFWSTALATRHRYRGCYSETLVLHQPLVMLALSQIKRACELLVETSSLSPRVQLVSSTSRSSSCRTSAPLHQEHLSYAFRICCVR